MKAMLLHHTSDLSKNFTPLEYTEAPDLVPNESELLVQVSMCGVCHTELDEIEGRMLPPHLPIILGHQIVGRVVKAPSGSNFQVGNRVGIAWIATACGKCHYCRAGFENLCPDFKATGRDRNGGYAQFTVSDPLFTFPIPTSLSDAQAAPLLCAGAIGFRSLRLSNLQDGQVLGLAGFGASAHLVLQLARYQFPHSNIYVFSRSSAERQFALDLGAQWAGAFGDTPLQLLNAIIDTTPAWLPVIEGLRFLAPGGRFIINAIRKEVTDQSLLTTLDYPTHLWMEKEVKSVANVSRSDVSDFLELAARIPILPEYQEYALEDANQALIELKNRKIRGAKILVV
jgi:alcohol dehydrogenase, propanol-preferring